MPKVSKDTAKHDDFGPVESWHEEVDGHQVEFVLFKPDINSTPMLKGLPGYQCHCPHWGHVLKGRVTFTIDGREEGHEPGDAFYVPPGHLQRAEAGTDYLQSVPPRRWPRSSSVTELELQPAGDLGGCCNGSCDRTT